MTSTVRNNTEQKRFELLVDEEVIGIAAYEDTGEMLVFTHTEIQPGHEGKGYAGTLIRFALDEVRERELLALPVCPFVQGWIEKHPDYHDLDYRSKAR